MRAIISRRETMKIIKQLTDSTYAAAQIAANKVEEQDPPTIKTKKKLKKLIHGTKYRKSKKGKASHPDD